MKCIIMYARYCMQCLSAVTAWRVIPGNCPSPFANGSLTGRPHTTAPPCMVVVHIIVIHVIHSNTAGRQPQPGSSHSGTQRMAGRLLRALLLIPTARGRIRQCRSHQRVTRFAMSGAVEGRVAVSPHEQRASTPDAVAGPNCKTAACVGQVNPHALALPTAHT